jgi:hypothetical protein
MEEITKLGDINSINDLFEYKISIKTICVLVFIWGFVCLIVVIIMFGGVQNTITYMGTIIESVRTTLIEIKNKNTGNTKVDKVDNTTEKSDNQ